MAFAAWLYEGDGLIHAAPKTQRAADSLSPAQRKELAERRADALRRMFPKLASWMKDRWLMARMTAVERYLSEATDVFDLERRIREVERRGLWH
ncbi:MAG: DUF3563 family protein [Sutterellaceae bacterium]|nr:DUF3563 family protein [Burkholderiaceae bacterium]MCX7901653.1 DUF3563 family protein [Burkholderiaceae bacterium]MDW8429705.1 DUF3563 family protein [Sutterellaceae bacterium]